MSDDFWRRPPPGQPPPDYPPTGLGEEPPPPALPPPDGPRLPRWLVVAAGVAGVCCVGLIAVVVVSSGRSTAPGAVVSGPAVGQAVRDGGFEFIVAGVHCGVKQVGDSSLGRAAAGQYCLATMTVHNVGGRPARFSAGEQVAGSADGDRYHPDAAAGLEANDNSQILDSEIDPGQQIQAIVVYDVPVTARLTKLILHESARSRGVTVNLPG